MTIRLLTNSDTDALKKFLSTHKAQCMFICSNLETAGIQYQDKIFHGEYWGAFNDISSQLEGVIVHYWNGKIMMFAPDIQILKDLASTLKTNIRRPIAGVLGPDSQASLVIKEFGLSDKSYSINRNERLYELNLDALDISDLPSGFSIAHSKATPKDQLIKWMKAYEIEALGADNNKDLDTRAQDKVQTLINGNCWILYQNNTPLSLSAFNAKIDDMVQIGPVWTPTEHRNKGFARILVRHTLIQAKQEGIQKAILFTNNQAAIKAYESIGFNVIGNYRLALLKNEI